VDLIDLLRRPEGKTLEYKRDLSSPEGVLKTIVAFANTAGGVVLVGVENRTRRVTGISDVLDAEEKLANLAADSILPLLVPNIDIVPWRKTHLLAIEVYPSSGRPHYLQRFGPDKGVFVRVGSTNRRADSIQIDQMRRYAQAGSFDEQPMPDLNSEALDFRAASEFFAPARKLTPAAFRTLKVTIMQQGREVPTIGGYLLFARNRFDLFPDSWIQAGRFMGTNRAKLIDRTEIRSPLAGAADETISFVQKHLSREAVIGSVRRTDRWTVPPVVLREGIVNAIVHSDYTERGAPLRVAIFDDRIEIENPGLLAAGLTIEDIRKGVSKLRNHVIGRVFHELGLIEQWGSGIPRMTSACREAGLPDPQFEELGARFRLTLSTKPDKSPKIDTTDRSILELLAAGEGRSTARIGVAISLSPRATRTRLAHLVQRGLIVEVGSGPQDPRRKYFRVGTADK